LITFDSNLLLNYFQAKTGTTPQAAAAGAASPLGGAAKAPTAPWSSLSTAPKTDELLTGVLMGRKFVDEYQTQLDVKGASEDYRQLFAMHQGLATLQALAERANEEGVTSAEMKRIQTAFARGTTEVGAYIDAAKFEQLRLTRGDATDKAKMSVGVPRTTPSYVTAPLHAGQPTDPVAAFQGDVKFTLSVKRMNNTTNTVEFDLAEMGSTDRTMANVVKYMNDKLAMNGNTTRFSVVRIPGEEKTAEINGKTVTVGAAVDQFALKIQGDTTELLTFSAPVTSPAVYVTQTVGNPAPKTKTAPAPGETPVLDQPDLRQELLKFETGTTADAVRRPDDVNWAEGRIFGGELPEGVEQVRETITGPDGSLYMLADVSVKVDGQTIKGAGDVALMKYDSAGKLVYTRTLGASNDATGMALSVGPDGKIAIAGSVTGGLQAGGVPIGAGVLAAIPKITKEDVGADPNKPDSFVVVFDPAGQELWSQRQGARDDDEATAVSFGADGSLYVLGRTKSSMPGATSNGNWDSYLRTFDVAGKLKSTTQFGTSGEDKPAGLVVDGTNVVVASVEGGEAVLRRFDVSDPTKAVLSNTRSLGSVGGGTIAGMTLEGGNIVLAGSTGAVLDVGNTTRGASGGIDTFAARVSANLDAGSDAIAYYGGVGDDRATAMTVAGGKVYLTGTTKTDLPGMAETLGTIDGFAVELDLDSGNVGWSQRFTAKDGMTAPTSIAVDTAGASVLDRLGLPKGTIAYSDSQQITAATSARAGDQFQIRSRVGGRAVTITIDQADTLETLKKKIERATSFSIKVEIVVDGDNRKLQLRPQNSRGAIEVLGGKGGLDALEALGLQEGFVRYTTVEDDVTVPADGGSPMYGLKLARDLSLATEADILNTINELTQATAVIRQAYRDLQAGMEPEVAKKDTGEVPAYLKSQIANYQAGLNRLLGSG
jgi:hypothetical protein